VKKWIATLVACAAWGLTAHAQVIEPILLLGRAAPNVLPGESFSINTPVRAASDGTIFYSGVRSGTAGTIESGLYRHAGNGSELVLRHGDPLPGTTFEFWDFVPRPQPSGAVGFYASLYLASWQSWYGGLFYYDAGGLHVIVHPQVPPPGPIPGPFLGYFAAFVFGGNQVAFITGGVSPDWLTLYAGAPGDIRELARVGSTAPGFGSLTHIGFCPTGTESISMNESGALAFVSRLSDQNDVLWLNDAQGLRAIARTIRAVYNPPQQNFVHISYPRVAHNGDVVFQGHVIGPGLPPLGVNGIWRYRAGQISTVFLAKTPIPGSPGELIPLLEHDAFRLAPRSDRMLIVGWTSAGTVMLEGLPGHFRLVARENRPLPGFPPNLRIPSWSTQTFTGGLYAFDSTILSDGTVIMNVDAFELGEDTRRALLRSDPAGHGSIVLRLGDPVHIAQQRPGPLTYYETSFDTDPRERILLTLATDSESALAWLRLPTLCYANCDQSPGDPALNIQDMLCFMQRYASGHPYANCDHSTDPLLSAADFACYLQRFAAGCP
jgi:hypothetical protein